MSFLQFLKKSQLIAAAAVVIFGCGCSQVPQKTPTQTSACPLKYPRHYSSAKNGFGICLPQKLTQTMSAGEIVFSGFAVPAGTNLQAKTLVLAAGNYAPMQGAAPAGNFTAGGVVFKRAKSEEGSAGHLTLHVIYTAAVGGKTLHFDFTHRSVNTGNFDPANRPQEYDRAAQIQLSEEIMSTFRRLP